MMSRPDFMKKQVLFIESFNVNRLRFSNSNLVMTDKDNKIVLQHSCYKIFLIFVYGEFTITSGLIKNLKKYAIPIVFLNYRLKPFLTIAPDNKGNFLLREKQYKNDNELVISKHIVRNKIINQIYLIKSLRYRTKKENKNLERINNLLLKVNSVVSFQELLGIEGNVAKIYFSTYFKNLNFVGRKPRCRTDVFNLLLDIGYHYLFNFIEANLELYGFDIYYGVYHKSFYLRKSLVCDLIEPFRCIIDRKIRKGFNLKQINISDFGFSNNQYYVKREFNKKYSKLFIEEILRYKEDIFLYVQKYYRSFIKGREITTYPFFDFEEVIKLKVKTIIIKN